MAYQLRAAKFEDYAEILGTENKYVLSLFYKKISKDNERLWHDHCFNASDLTCKKMSEALICFLRDLDGDLLLSVESRVNDRNVALEVSNHFAQDKSELELWQDFEAACSGQEQLSYQEHFPNEY